MTQIFFTSDTHFGHKSFLGYRSEVHKKLFPSEHHMNEFLIESWNSVVRPKDIVWHLGDVAWGDQHLHYLARCNGRKELILGNHDKLRAKHYLRYFHDLHGIVKKYGVVMSHVPIHPQEMQYKNWSTNVHGHIHHKEKLLKEPEYICVNVDVAGAVPISLDEIRSKIGKQNNNSSL